MLYDIDSVRGWYTANCMKLTINISKCILFSRKTYLFFYEYTLC
jgi:hypothetical protein